jgi:hypothetical protein
LPFNTANIHFQTNYHIAVPLFFPVLTHETHLLIDHKLSPHGVESSTNSNADDDTCKKYQLATDMVAHALKAPTKGNQLGRDSLESS